MTIWKNHVTAEAPAAVARQHTTRSASAGVPPKNRQAGRVTTLHFQSKRFQENVLDGTKRDYYDTWFRRNVLDGTKSW